MTRTWPSTRTPGRCKINPDALEVMDALYVLYRETRQGAEGGRDAREDAAEPGAAGRPAAAQAGVLRAGRDQPRRAATTSTGRWSAFNAALDADHEVHRGVHRASRRCWARNKQWKPLEENYARMIQRLPKTDETHPARMALWRALGDLYLQILKQPEAAVMAYKVVAPGLPEDATVQETYAELAARRAGQRGEGDRRVAPRAADDRATRARSPAAGRAGGPARRTTTRRGSRPRWSSGLIGDAGAAEKEILTKLTPYAKKQRGGAAATLLRPALGSAPRSTRECARRSPS